MTWNTETVTTTVDGTRVAAQQAGEADAVVLCVHGLASSSASLGPLVEVLAEHGYRALAPDLRGHGDSEGHRARISRERALRDLAAWRDHVRSEGACVAAIVGHSLGGLWAIAAARSWDLEAVVAIATPVSIRHELSVVERAAYRVGSLVDRVLAPLGVDLRVPNQVGVGDVLATEQARQTARRVGLLADSLPLANARDLLALDGARMAGHVDAPALVARARGDGLVGEASQRKLFAAVPDPKRWIELEGPHECFFDVDGRRAAEPVADALDEELDCRLCLG